MTIAGTAQVDYPIRTRVSVAYGSPQTNTVGQVDLEFSTQPQREPEARCEQDDDDHDRQHDADAERHPLVIAARWRDGEGVALPIRLRRRGGRIARTAAAPRALAVNIELPCPADRTFHPVNVSLDSRSGSRVEVWTGAGVLAGWEAEAELSVVEPGDGQVEVGEAGVDEYGVVGA